EAVLGVVLDARAVERCVRAEERDDGHDAHGDEQCDGQYLRPHPPQVAHELAVERLHQLSSPGSARRSLTSSDVIPPLDMWMTRSPMAAIATLCVITAIVVCSVRLTSTSADSTSLPVS